MSYSLMFEMILGVVGGLGIFLLGMKNMSEGMQVIAEYNDADVLQRKYIYGPGIDEPVCMIDATDKIRVTIITLTAWEASQR